ncbi:MAG: GDP-mannose 4,6-dehydratase, partial [Clostridia bacterium]|nr:GDP-mannose 4,6-dehydratase [Clostridia bacterium]
TNTYGETKLSMEKMFKWTANAHGLRFVSLRYFNACGAHESGVIGEAHNPETHLIPIILQAAAGVRECISVYGTDYPTRDGTCVRDYIHVYDLAKAHVAALKYLLDGGKSDIFNLGTEIGSTVKEVIDAAVRITGRDIKVVYGERRAGDPAVLTASNKKAREILGWKPEKTLDDIISSAWKWHGNNPKGYGN